jgi:ribonuclease D
MHACLRQARVEPRERPFDPEDFWRIKGVNDLGRQQQAILRNLYVFRDGLARKRDRPPFRIMNDGVMVYLSQRRPKDRKELSKVKGVPKPILHRHADDLLAAIREGEAVDLETIRKPVKPRTPRDVSNRYEKLRTWRKDVAAERGVEPDIVIGKDSLMALATAHPSTPEQLQAVPEIDDWERDRYGDALLQILKEPS